MTAPQSKRTTIDIDLDEQENLKLSCEDTEFEDSAVIRIFGFIDTFNSDFFRVQVYRVIDAGFRNIIIDASAATFMSSTGIGAFTALLKKIREAGGSLVIFGMPPKIYEVFQLLGFTNFFHFCDTMEEALGAINGRSLPAESKKIFPVIFSCPVCHRRLKTSRPGRFRCSSCRVILAVGSEGKVLLG